jgi:C4-dicarboxylate transporter DctM subunit
MDRDLIAIGFVVLLVSGLVLGIPIAVILLLLAGIGITLVASIDVNAVLATAFHAQMTTWSLTALPLFVLMGEILSRSRTAERMFESFVPFLAPVPGGLVQVNIFASGLFSALSGSSTATVATIGKLCYPQLQRRGYPDGLSIGSLAGSGTLGILIPPSVALILYGFAADVSIGKLFLAGVVPGLMIMAMFSLYAGIVLRRHRGERQRFTAADRLRALVNLLPFVALIVVVLGSIYAGFATPTEAAVLGVLGAAVLAVLDGSASFGLFRGAIRATVLFSAAIGFVLAASAALQVAMAFTGIPRAVMGWVTDMDLGMYALLAIVALLIIVLGCFIDGLSIIVLTSAVLFPVVKAAGVDMLWFGVFMVILIEIGLITPPIGFNLFVLQRVTGRDIDRIALAAVPFILLLMAAAVIVTLLPGLVTWLPSVLR